MAVARSNRALALVVKEVLRLGGYIEYEGTSTAGSTTTLTDAVNMRVPTAQANAVTGRFLWMPSGTGIGQQAEVITYGTIGVFTWQATLTSPAADTGWVLCKVRPQRAIDAIAEVTRAAAWKQAIPYMHTGLVTNNLLENADFEEWSSGTTSAPDGWTLAGAGSSIAQETYNSNADGTPSGVFHPAITAGAGAVATLTQNVEAKYLPLIRGQGLTLQGMIEEAVAADATVRVSYSNSADSSTNNDTAGTYTGNWESIGGYGGSGVTITMPDPVTNLSVQARIALSAVSRIDDLMLYGPYIYEYSLPTTFIGLEYDIWMEDGFRSKNYSIRLKYGADWITRRRESAPSTSKYPNAVIQFKRPLPSGRHLKVSGYKAPTVQTTQSSNVDPNPVWLATAAAVRLMEQEGVELNSPQYFRLKHLKEDLARMEATTEGNTLKDILFIPVESR